jgi:hypothetical protein
MENGGFEALLHHLLNDVEMGDFDPRLHLPTDELDEQKTHSLRGVEAVWFECLQRGALPGKVRSDGSVVLRCSDLVKWASQQRQRGWDILRTEHVGYLLGSPPRTRKPGMDFRKYKAPIDEGWVQVYEIPALAEARKKWSSNRFLVDWGEEKNVRWQEESL